MSENPGLSHIKSLYGGYWNFDLKDFCYMVNPYFPPGDLLNSIADSLPLLSKSYPSTNKHISMLLADHLDADTENVVGSNGASELISLICQMFINKMAVPIPTFDEYINRLRIQGKDVCLFNTRMKDNFKLDLDLYVTYARDSGANAILFCRPNNPTGTLISIDDMKLTLDKLTDFDVVLVDESFIEFSGATDDTSILNLIDMYKNLCIIKSLSKVYGVPGLRIGCAICGDIEKGKSAAIPS